MNLIRRERARRPALTPEQLPPVVRSICCLMIDHGLAHRGKVTTEDVRAAVECMFPGHDCRDYSVATRALKRLKVAVKIGKVPVACRTLVVWRVDLKKAREFVLRLLDAG